MKNRYYAYFIGGPFDLTKRIIRTIESRIDFWEPVELQEWNDKEQTVECEKVSYRLKAHTEEDVLVYILEGKYYNKRK